MINKILHYFLGQCKEIPELRDDEEKKVVSELYSKIHLLNTDISEIKNSTWKDICKEIKADKRARYIKVVSYSAAASIIPFAIFIIFFYKTPDDNVSFQDNRFASVNKEVSNSIVLYSGDAKINLSKVGDGKITQNDKVSIIKNNKQISYNKKSVSKSDNSAVKINKVVVPRGAFYKIELSDGTLVSLNSDSELSFPEVFKGKDRVVELKGEAYFEVTKDAKHPFKVNFNKGMVKVLGTSFAITSYESDNKSSAVLKEGSVEFIINNDSGKLKKYRLNPGFKISNNFKIQKVNLNKELGWLSGKFYFDNMSLKEILRKLNRWYDFKYKFIDIEASEYLFTGVAERGERIDCFLEKIEMTTNIYFELDKSTNTILIKKK